MVKRFAKNLNYNMNLSDLEIHNFIQKELGTDPMTAKKYVIPLKNELNKGKLDSLDGYNFASTKTALNPIPVNKGPRKPPGYHQLHEDMNVSPTCSCSVCNSVVDCNSGACQNCSADSTHFLRGDPKTRRDEFKPNMNPGKPTNVLINAAVLDNKKKDDKKPFNKKLEPYKTEIGGIPTVEKFFSDPDIDENSDKNHMDSVQQTWEELGGDE